MRSHAKARGGCAAGRHEDLDSNAQILGGDEKTRPRKKDVPSGSEQSVTIYYTQKVRMDADVQKKKTVTLPRVELGTFASGERRDIHYAKGP